MKSASFYLLFFFGISLFANAQKGTIESFRLPAPPVIDGNVDEWGTEWLADPHGKFAYNIANDDNNLYIRIRLSEPVTERKVGLFGLTILLNPTGKKGGKLGIKFPLAHDLDELNKQKQPDGPMTAARMVQMNKDLIADSEALELLGLSKEPITSTRLGLMNGIELIIIANEAGDYIYEGKIPFKAFKIKKSEVKVLGVTLQTGRLINKSAPNTTPQGPGGGGMGNQQYGRGGGYGSPYGSRGIGYGNSGAPQAPRTPYNEFNSATVMSVRVILQ